MASPSPKTVLFLCTGNYYRSRFAEVLFNTVAVRMGLPWRASSRALALERGVGNVGPMAPSAVRALEALGARSAADCARLPAAVTAEELRDADRVIALKQTEHRPLVQERHPEWCDKVEFWHIDDAPEVLPLIEQEVMTLVASLLGGGRGAAAAAAPPPVSAAGPKKPRLTAKVRRETAGRRGKGVTTIFDLALDATGLAELAALLKQRCGTGGTVKDGRIEIQGDQRDRIVAELEKLGYQVKRAGG
jgi:protein-tyrosine phosphatase